MISKVLMSPALEPLRNEIRDRAAEALHSARDKMIEPLRQTRDVVMERASQMERYANDQCERVARQVSANPFTALAIAFAAGWLAASVFGRSHAAE